ncbi:YIP1 family protein [Halocatena halophila]|uniref:YIP1 family protein n=1 Tax=Halocatena halophila TaxID=2814576 RepID=UPI002ED6611C
MIVRPDQAFESGAPSFRIACAIVLVLAVANGFGVAHSIQVVTELVSGTVRIESSFDRTAMRTATGVVARATNGLVLGAVLAVLSCWLATAAVFALLLGRNRGGFRELLALAGVGFAPAAVRYTARPLFVSRAGSSWPVPETAPGLREAAPRFVTGVTLEPFLVVAVVTILWQAVIYVYGLSSLTDVSRRRAAMWVGPVVVAFVGSLSMEPFQGQFSIVSLFCLCVGGPLVTWPYKLSKFGEQLDAIGSKRRMRDVEPAAWNVWLNRLLGTVFCTASIVFFGGTALL